MRRYSGLGVLACAVMLLVQPTYAQPVHYFAFMDGPSESPPVPSPGTGLALVSIDLTAMTLHVQANFTDLVAPTTAAHIHAPTAVPLAGTVGVATETPSFTGFPLGVTSGSMDQTYDMSSASTWNAPFITNNGGTPESAAAAFAQYLSEGRAYFNIHSSFAPGGEIRGFLIVPEPGSGAVLGIAGTVALARRRARPHA